MKLAAAKDPKEMKIKTRLEAALTREGGVQSRGERKRKTGNMGGLNFSMLGETLRAVPGG